MDRQQQINWAASLVAIGLVLILGFLTWALVYRTVPSSNSDALLLLIGNLAGLVGIVVAFYFGSSSENKKLAETVNVQAKTAATAGAALGGTDGSTMVIPTDTSATVTPTDGGAVIHKEPSEDNL